MSGLTDQPGKITKLTGPVSISDPGIDPEFADVIRQRDEKLQRNAERLTPQQRRQVMVQLTREVSS